MTSRRTRGVSVAESAMMGVPRGRKALTMPMELYFLRKSAPQCEIQWASSTMTESTRRPNCELRRTRLTNVRDCNISGDIRTM